MCGSPRSTASRAAKSGQEQQERAGTNGFGFTGSWTAVFLLNVGRRDLVGKITAVEQVGAPLLDAIYLPALHPLLQGDHRDARERGQLGCGDDKGFQKAAGAVVHNRVRFMDPSYPSKLGVCQPTVAAKHSI